MNKKLYTAIIFFIPGHPFPAMKYRKISSMDKFKNFAAEKYQGKISSINFYDRDTKEFVKQERV